MALDTNIALGVKPVEQPNMLAQMGQMMQIRQAQQQYDQQNALRDAFAQGADITDPATFRRIAQQDPTLAYKLKGQHLEQTQKGVETGIKINEALGGGLEWLSKNPSLDNAKNLFSDLVNKGVLPPDKAQAMFAKLQAEPDKIGYYANLGYQSAIGADKKLTNATTIRGQDLSHSVGMANVGLARERLTADMTPLAIDDATVDLVANRYLIDGTLPPLGMGKPAAMLRAKILDRAQAIATATPPPKPNVNAMTEPTPSVSAVAPVVGAAPVTNAAPIAPVVGAAPVTTPPTTTTTTPTPVGVSPQQAAQNIITNKTNTATQKRALTDFSTGIQGRMVNSMNTAVEHLSTLTELADALKNNDVRAINTVGNLVAKQTGSPAPTNFAAARQIVAQEIVKAIVANGGTGKERDEAASNIAAAGSPEQLAGVISTYQELLAGQLKSLGLQYKNTTGRDDFNTKLLPSTLRALSRIETGTPAKTGDITSDASVAKVVGANTVTTPDGKSYTFPNAEAANAFKKKIAQ